MRSQESKAKLSDALNELSFIENKIQSIRAEINRKFNSDYIDTGYIREKIEKISDSLVIVKDDLGVKA